MGVRSVGLPSSVLECWAGCNAEGAAAGSASACTAAEGEEASMLGFFKWARASRRKEFGRGEDSGERGLAACFG